MVMIFLTSFDHEGTPSSTHGAPGNERMDHSFVILQKNRVQNPSFPPPRPRPPSNAPNMITSNQLPHHNQQNPGEGVPLRSLDESFVVLPSSAASMYRFEPTSTISEGLGIHHSTGVGVEEGSSIVNPVNSTFNATFNANIHVLTRVFDIASSQSQVFCN